MGSLLCLSCNMIFLIIGFFCWFSSTWEGPALHKNGAGWISFYYFDHQKILLSAKFTRRTRNDVGHSIVSSSAAFRKNVSYTYKFGQQRFLYSMEGDGMKDKE